MNTVIVEDNKLQKWIHLHGADTWYGKPSRMHLYHEYPILSADVRAKSTEFPTLSFIVMDVTHMFGECEQGRNIMTQFTMPVKAQTELPIDAPEQYLILARFYAKYTTKIQNGVPVYDFGVEDDEDFCCWKEGRTSEVVQAYYLDAFNLFHHIQMAASKSWKNVEKIKKYEKHEIERGEDILNYKPVKLSEYVTYSYSKNESEVVREYKRHIDGWGVRGHYRHYKNGKTIFINAYEKGSGLKKDTKYTIGGD